MMGRLLTGAAFFVAAGCALCGRHAALPYPSDLFFRAVFFSALPFVAVPVMLGLGWALGRAHLRPELPQLGSLLP